MYIFVPCAVCRCEGYLRRQRWLARSPGTDLFRGDLDDYKPWKLLCDWDGKCPSHQPINQRWGYSSQCFKFGNHNAALLNSNRWGFRMQESRDQMCSYSSELKTQTLGRLGPHGIRNQYKHSWFFKSTAVGFFSSFSGGLVYKCDCYNTTFVFSSSYTGDWYQEIFNGLQMLKHWWGV